MVTIREALPPCPNPDCYCHRTITPDPLWRKIINTMWREHEQAALRDLTKAAMLP